MIKLLEEHGRRMDKHSENSNWVRKYKEETNRTGKNNKINNTIERKKKISSRLDDIEEQISNQEDRVVVISQTKQQKEKNEFLEMRMV